MRTPLIAAGAVLMLATHGTARAAESYDNCKYTITTLPVIVASQGVWCLKGDVATLAATGEAITVTASNVTIECNDFKLGGFGGGPATTTTGVLLDGVANATIRNCNIRGFRIGVLATAGSAHVIEDNRFEGITARAIDLDAPGSVIRRNRIVDTGGAAGADYTYGILTVYETEIRDNTISTVTAIAGGLVFGIYTNLNSGGLVTGNHVSGLSVGSSGAFGIYNLNAGDLIVDGNFLQHSPLEGTALRCNGGAALASNNRIVGFLVDNDSCAASGNIAP